MFWFSGYLSMQYWVIILDKYFYSKKRGYKYPIGRSWEQDIMCFVIKYRNQVMLERMKGWYRRKDDKMNSIITNMTQSRNAISHHLSIYKVVPIICYSNLTTNILTVGPQKKKNGFEVILLNNLIVRTNTMSNVLYSTIN